MKIEFRVWDKNKRKMLYLYPNDTILFKDGNKIYKADILKDTLDNLYIVDFIRGCFYLKTRYEKNGEWLEWLPMSEITQLAEPVDFEIIGNIYENPELMEG